MFDPRDVQISPHFNSKEFIVSDNYPDLAAEIQFTAQDLTKLYYLVVMVLEPVRTSKAVRFKINSGKRSVELNKNLGGSKTSDHLYYGLSCACDFTVVYPDNGSTQLAVYDTWVVLQNMQFGQLIYYGPEYGNFIHISLPTRKHQNEVMKRITDGYQRII